MRFWLTLLLAVTTAAAVAQEGRARRHGPGEDGEHVMERGMPRHGGMHRDERQRLRDDLKSGRREDWRRHWRGPHGDARRGGPPLAPEEREQLRRDLREVNREMRERR